MKIVIYTNSISPHQLPLASELVDALGAENVLYAYENAESKGRQSLGWKQEPESWCRKASECIDIIENCEMLLVGGLRPTTLLETRAKYNRRTLYMSERWFKPPLGMLRLLYPKYFIMAWRVVKLLTKSSTFIYLPIGIHSAKDMARLCGLLHGDLRCLFNTPKLNFESEPGGKIWLENDKDNKKYCLNKMKMWGYFVKPSRYDLSQTQQNKIENRKEIKILWVGRMLNLKRVDTIIRAVIENANLKLVDDTLPKISLNIYGSGPEEAHLKRMSYGYEKLIKFYPPVPIDDVRKLMHEHDIYVFSSNGYEGWGAVVSEALEEGMKVIGTYEAGSCATILPKENLFHVGDWQFLLKILHNHVKATKINNWTAKVASKIILN